MRRNDEDGRLGEAHGAGGSERWDPAQAVELLGRRLGGAILLAGALIGLGLYAGGGDSEGPNYQAFAADGEVFRVNMESGTIIACNADRCTRILERGQDLAEDQANTLFKAAPPPPVATAPAGQPAAPAPTPATQPLLPPSS